MIDLVGAVPPAAREVAEQYYMSVAQFLECWDPREFSARSHERALRAAESSLARDRRPRCVVATSIGYVVYPLRDQAKSSRRGGGALGSGDTCAPVDRGGDASANNTTSVIPAPAGREGAAGRGASPPRVRLGLSGG